MRSRASTAGLWFCVAACSLPAACSRRTPPPPPPEKITDPAVSAAASAIARAIVGPPPSALGQKLGPEYAVHVACTSGESCLVDLVDDHGLPLGRWNFAHLAQLGEALRSHAVSRVILTADASVPYARVIEVIDAARAGGAPDVSFGVATGDR
jgi:hypothetical protein